MVSMEEQKKRRTRRKFTDEDKARAVRLVLKEGQTAARAWSTTSAKLASTSAGSAWRGL